MTDAEFNQACQFMIQLGELGHRSGLSFYELESHLSRVSNRLGFSGRVLATPQSHGIT